MQTFGKAQQKWLSRYLELLNGFPSHDTFNRVFRASDPEAFMDCFILCTQSLRSVLDCEIVPVDAMDRRLAIR